MKKDPKPLKILFVGNSSMGMYNFRRHLILRGIEQGYTIKVLAPSDKYADLLKNLNIDFSHIPLNTDSKNPLNELRAIFNLIRYYRSFKPDLAIHYTIKPNNYGTLAARLSGARSWAVITGLGYPFSKKGLLQTFSKLIYKFALKYVDKVFFLNADDKSFFVSNFNLPPHKITLIPGEGIDCRFYKRKMSYPVPRTIYFIGRLLKDKGINLFVQAAKYFFTESDSDVEFKILGSLDFSKANSVDRTFHDTIAEMPNIEYLGEAMDVRPHLEKASCVILPSYYEGIPITLLEASAMEIPIITTDTVGCRDVVVDGKTGFLVEEKNIDDLTEKLKSFLNLSYTQRKYMGKNGRDYVCKHFSMEKVLAIYEKAIQETLTHVRENSRKG